MTKFSTLFIIAAGLACCHPANGASPGPRGNFDKNALMAHPRINTPNVEGLATRGLMYFDMANDIGAVDRLQEALSYEVAAQTMPVGGKWDLEEALALAKVLSGNPAALEIASSWVLTHQTSPHRADMALLVADLLLEQGLTGEAREAYEAIDIDALSPMLRDDYIYHQAYTYLLLGSYAEAESCFLNQELQTSEKYGNAARFYVGYVAYVDQDYKAALREWEKVNEATLPGKTVNYYRAQIAYYEGDYEAALRLARPLLSEKDIPAGFNAEANRVVGESLYQTGDAAGAISYLKKYVSEVDTPERSTMYILGLAQYEEGNYSAAVESLTPVTTDQSAMGQSAYLYIGQALLKLGDDNGAIMAFNRALSLNIDKEVTEAAYYNYAVAKSRGGGVPFASSVNIFEDFLARFPNSRYADDVAGYIVTGYVTDGNYEAALKSINRIKKPDRDILAAKQKVLYMLGAKLLANDKTPEAVEMLKQARELAEYDAVTAAEVNLVLGEALYRAGDYDEAAKVQLEYLKSGNEKSTNRAVALYDLGYTRMAQEEWSKAEKNFERLMASPGNLNELTLADAQTRLGDARYYQRNWQGAARAYEEAYKLYPEGGDYPLFQTAVMQGYGREYAAKLSSLEKLLNRYPNSALIPDALLEEAEAYIQLNEPEKANGVYRKLSKDYSETAQGRKAFLFLGASQAGKGDIDSAIGTYEKLISLASTSEEAHEAMEAVKRLHAERGTLDEYTAFVEKIEGAPTLSVGEAESLSWTAAERSYLNGKGVSLLENYVKEYPAGRYTARALSYLLENADDNGSEQESYRWASLLVKDFPDNEATEYALIVKADIDYDRGRGMDALKAWEMLEQKASTPENKNLARIGVLRVSRDLNDSKRMRAMADALLKSTTLGAEEKTEATFSRALAMQIDGETEGAVTVWKELAVNTDDIFGAEAAVYAAEALNSMERYDEAAKLAEKFIASGTPHTYWLARGFIVLSDALSAQGKNFEAKEYLKALKENYPGEEPDIFDMIDERMK